MSLRSFLAFVLGGVVLVATTRAPHPAYAQNSGAQEQHTQENSIQIGTGVGVGVSVTASKGGDGTGRVTVREADAAAIKELLKRDPKQPRPLLVNFWATWCEPCREEFPDLVSIGRDYHARGLEFIVISLDDVTDIKTTVPQFLEEMHANMPAYLLNPSDPDALIPAVDPTWGGALPATFLFDAHGQIAFKQMGRVKVGELRAALEKVLSEK